MLTGPSLLPRSGGKAKQLVVFCHGYGSSGADLISLAPSWSGIMPDAEFLAPNGPDICESYSFGYQWFGLREFTPYYVDAGLMVSRPILRKYFLELLAQRALTPSDLAIVGFSQGGMVALDMMFALQGLRGVICYSGGFYPPSDIPLPEPHPEVLLVHGDADTCVPYEYCLKAQGLLKKLGLQPQTLTCSGLGHSIDSEGLKVGGKFLAQLFSSKQPVMYMKQQ
jgi:phospholipase/carboxylesterase